MQVRTRTRHQALTNHYYCHHPFRFTRSITGNNSTQDYNLNDDYYVLYGRGNNDPVAGRLRTHIGERTPLPSISSTKLNPVKDSGVILDVSTFENVKRGLIRAHGIMMLIAWPLVAATGIFFAAYMRQALPKGGWFQVHRVLMIVSLLVAAVAFLIIFVSQSHNSIPGLIKLGANYVCPQEMPLG